MVVLCVAGALSTSCDGFYMVRGVVHGDGSNVESRLSDVAVSAELRPHPRVPAGRSVTDERGEFLVTFVGPPYGQAKQLLLTFEKNGCSAQEIHLDPREPQLCPGSDHARACWAVEVWMKCAASP